MKKFLLIILLLSICTISHAQQYLWRYRTHATDCTSLTSGKTTDLCYEQDSNSLYKCVPSSGDCDTASEWKLTEGGEFVNRTWETIAQPSGITGPSFTEVNSMGVHKGNLYLGYDMATSAKVYKWDGSVLTAMGTPGIGAQFTGITFLIDYKGDLYAGVQGSVGGAGDVYVSTNDGTTWSKSFENTQDIFAYSAAVFKGKLYVGQGYTASRVSVFDGTTWSTAYAGLSGAGLILSMKVFEGRLFAALGSSGGLGDSAIISSIDGTTWVTETSVDKTIVNEFNILEEFNGKLYCTMTGTPNALYVRNNVTGTWAAGPTLFSGGQVWGILNYNGALYIGRTSNSPTPAIIYKSFDGVTFTSDFTPTTGGMGYEAFRMINYNGSIYVGTGGDASVGAGAELWKKTDSLGQLVDTSNLIVNKFRQNTDSNYPFTNDPSAVGLSAPIVFDSNVGIGTVNTSGAKLLVQGTGTSASVSSLTVRNSAATPGFMVRDDGFVGIGTENPTAVNTQYVVNITRNDNAMRILALNNKNTGTSAGAGFELVTTDSNGYLRQYPSNSTNPVGVNRTVLANETGTGLSQVAINGDLRFITGDGSNTGEAMRIVNAGQVGIGTTIPTGGNTQYFLNVFNSANALRTIVVKNPNAGTSASAGYELQTSDTNAFFRAYPSNSANSVGVNRAVLEVESGDGLTIATNNGNIKFTGGGFGGTLFTIITGAGNVGIGSATPGALLDLAGGRMRTVGIGTTVPQAACIKADGTFGYYTTTTFAGTCN